VGAFSNSPAVMFTVPAGKRLIVEHFSTEAFVASGTVVTRFVLGVAIPGSGVTNSLHFIAPSYTVSCGSDCAGPNQTISVASQPVRLYVDAGQQLTFNAAFSAPVGANTFMAASMSGYLVDAP
jgi:hypothetical protein